MQLEQEWKTFEAHLPELKAHEGKYALIKGGTLFGVFETFDQAMDAGYARFGLQIFMAQKIRIKPAPLPFTRDLLRP